MAEAGRSDVLLIVVAREDAVEELGEIVIGFGEELVSIGKNGVSGAVCHTDCCGTPSFALEAGDASISVSAGRLVAEGMGGSSPVVVEDGLTTGPSSLLLFTDGWSAVSHGNGTPVTIHPSGKPPREDAPLSVLCGRYLCQVNRRRLCVRDLETGEDMVVRREAMFAS